MLFKVGDQELPGEISEIIISFLQFKDLINYGKVWNDVDERMWKKFFKRKLNSNSLWINTFKFLGWSLLGSTPNLFISNDAKKISQDIIICNKLTQHNWGKGKYLQRESCFDKNEEKEPLISHGLVSLDCSRAAVWLKKPHSQITVFRRPHLEKEMVIDLVIDVTCMFLKDDLLFVGFDQGLIRIWDLQSTNLVTELHDQVTGRVGYIHYSHSTLVTLSNLAPFPGKVVVTTRSFTNPKENSTTTKESLFPICTSYGVVDLDGNFLILCGSMDNLNNRSSLDDPEEIGIFIWTVDNLSLHRYIPDPEDDTCVSLKSSKGLLFMAYLEFFCVYDISSDCCLRRVKQKPFHGLNSVGFNSDYIMTACIIEETETEAKVIKVWKLSDFCQESIPVSECLAFSMASPLLDNPYIELVCDSFQIVGYDYFKQSRIIVFDFWNQVCED